MIPGETLVAGGSITINRDLPVTLLTVTNTGQVPVHVSAHFHVFEANKRLRFDRRHAWGMRLDVAADESVRIEPGASTEVALVPLAGARIVRGFNGAVNGSLDDQNPDEALRRLIDRGFLHDPVN